MSESRSKKPIYEFVSELSNEPISERDEAINRKKTQLILRPWSFHRTNPFLHHLFAPVGQAVLPPANPSLVASAILSPPNLWTRSARRSPIPSP